MAFLLLKARFLPATVFVPLWGLKLCQVQGLSFNGLRVWNFGFKVEGFGLFRGVGFLGFSIEL